MSAGDCCSGAFRAPAKGGEPPSRRFARRILEAAGYVIPGFLLALLPKCPACLTAWLAVAAGIGLSPRTASRLRVLL